MQTMLAVAGGVVIAGIILGFLWNGLNLLLSPAQPEDSGTATFLGILFLLVGASTAFWLLFIHTGIIAFTSNG